ncbi:MAG: TetR/AcrR family transcriptional regulator [Anaerolineaceae bacterium]|jgi:AcrR family transcriptional regulator
MTSPMKANAILDHENAERILEEGWKLFQQKGYRGVTVDELCRHCGLTKPTLYYYFQDKENLFVQVLQYRLEGFHKVVEQPGTLAERLQRVATSILENFQTEYGILLRDREHIKKPENLECIRDAFHSELFGPLIALMQSGIDRGELEGNNPEMLTLIFLGVVNNLIGKAAEMGVENSTLARQLTGYFLNGARKA